MKVDVGTVALDPDEGLSAEHYDIYKSRDGKNFLQVVRKTMQVAGRKSVEILKTLNGKVVPDLVKSGGLVTFD